VNKNFSLLRISVFKKIKFKGVIPTTRQQLVFGNAKIGKQSVIIPYLPSTQSKKIIQKNQRIKKLKNQKNQKKLCDSLCLLCETSCSNKLRIEQSKPLRLCDFARNKTARNKTTKKTKKIKKI
jgi:hypothetical protein